MLKYIHVLPNDVLRILDG